MYKICVVTTVSITLKAFVLELAKFLHQTGKYEIHFVCDLDSDFTSVLPEYIHYHPISMSRGISFGGFKAVFEMYKLFKREKYDLVQYSTPNASCYASIAAKLAGIKARLYCQWGIAYVGFEGIKRKIFKMIEKNTCKMSTVVEPDSYGNLNFSREENLYTDKKSRVVWNGSASGVNLEKFDISKKEIWARQIRQRHQIPDDARVFIFIGRITRDKGINELFEATKRLLEENNDVYLLLVGSEEKTDMLEPELYKWSKTSRRVIYAGFSNEVEKYLSASDVYVLPSYREGFGLAVVEAEAMGLPVIVSNIPGPTDAMKKDITGLVVEKKNASELYEAMKKLYTLGELVKLMGSSAAEFASQCFDQKTLFEKIHKDRLELIQNNK